MGFWIEDARDPDSHVAFRTTLSRLQPADLVLKIVSTCPFLLYLNGKFVAEGPVRAPKEQPQLQEFVFHLSAGKHAVAIHSKFDGVETRMHAVSLPAISASATVDGLVAHLDWKAAPLTGYNRAKRRISEEFGWIDWLDTGQFPAEWMLPQFDDTGWKTPESVKLAAPFPAIIDLPAPHPIKPKMVAKGHFTEDFGYESDDLPVRFFLRDLDALHGRPQGLWRRYDLGRVRLGRPAFTLDLPKGAVVEFGMCEALKHGRVTPWITLSGGASCNFDRFVARGGPQTFMPHSPKGGRYLEVHVAAETRQIHFIKEDFLERTYHGEPQGAFRSSEHRLNQIWETGVSTYRSCSEDAVIDNPTRERGEWVGDSLTVGLENASCAYSDLRLFKKVLVDSAQCARPDGLIPGLCPSNISFLSTYACHWTNACVRYLELSGDKETFSDLFPIAVKNMAAFKSNLTNEGLTADLGWAFVDWGYVVNDGPSDMGLNMIYLGALRSMDRYCRLMGIEGSEYTGTADQIERILRKYLAAETDWAKIGLQRAVFAARLGLLDPARLGECVRFIKRHYLSCFPNDPMAPNLADPGMAQPRLITPFFSHFALPVLWEHGEGDFVLDQYRTCWGWALDQGLTTWPEVFDLRWSHCHEWSGCPTWQLTRYALGVWPRHDIGRNTFELKPSPCGLDSIDARIPLPGSTDALQVTKRGSNWVFTSNVLVTIVVGDNRESFHGTKALQLGM